MKESNLFYICIYIFLLQLFLKSFAHLYIEYFFLI